MWDKSLPDTFMLGNYVGCCLATDGPQFPAMVQRRIDDGMFMHVVIDKETNKPISLAWLFFAKDSKSPGDIYVVANFLEISASYAQDKFLLDMIVEHLKEYSAQYANTVGAKGFLIARLTYGSIPNNDDTPMKDIQLVKVGGFLELDKSISSGYYLKSLSASTFYLYESKISKQENSAQLTYAQSPFHYPPKDGICPQPSNKISNIKKILDYILNKNEHEFSEFEDTETISALSHRCDTIKSDEEYIQLQKDFAAALKNNNLKVRGNGNTVLMLAIQQGKNDIAQTIIECDVDLNAQNVFGTTALMFAVEKPKNAELIEQLMNSGAAVDQIDSDGQSALIKAACKSTRDEELLDNIQILMKHGADSQLRDNGNSTAADRARQFDCPPSVIAQLNAIPKPKSSI
jgi:hypothetical protein